MAIQTIGDGGGDDERGFENWTVRHSPVDRADIRKVGAATYEGLGQKPGGRRWNQLTVGEFEVFITYEGFPEDESPEEKKNESLDWLGSSSEEPIESHPKIGELTAKYNGFEDGEGRIRFPQYLSGDAEKVAADAVGASFGGGVGFGLSAITSVATAAVNAYKAVSDLDPNPMAGTEIYIARHRILKHTFASVKFPKREAELDGKVVQDLPPNTPGGKREGRDYMVFVQLLSWRGTKENGAYDCELHYVESEEGGWPPNYLVVS